MLDVVSVGSVLLLLRSALEEVGDRVENMMFEFDGDLLVVVCGGVGDVDKAKTAGPPAEYQEEFKEIGVNDFPEFGQGSKVPGDCLHMKRTRSTLSSHAGRGIPVGVSGRDGDDVPTSRHTTMDPLLVCGLLRSLNRMTPISTSSSSMTWYTQPGR